MTTRMTNNISKALTRLEALLRVAQPGSGASIQERHTAIGEALRMVVALRDASHGDDQEWVEAVVMRFESCACGKDIRPGQRAVRSGPNWRHLSCY